MSDLSYKTSAKLRALLVDDEQIARERLKKLLQDYAHQLIVVGEAKDAASALESIHQLKPDLVFLDIEMPGKSGLALLKELENPPLIVFITAYEQYALKAFEENSIDYLLKPVEKERLALTMQRLQERQQTPLFSPAQWQQVLEKMQPKKALTIIPVKTGDKIQLVPLSEVIFFEAKEKYVNLHSFSRSYLLDQSLTYIEERLPDNFLRVQRGYIINQHKIKEIHRYFNGGYLFEMEDAGHSKIKSGSTYNASLKLLFEF